MKTIEKTVYNFDELSDEAKEKAREWLRSGNDFSFHAECVIEDAKTIAALMGIDIERVYYRGFCSQGDGACFEAEYSYKKGSVKAVIKYAPLDTDLHRLVKALAQLQKRNFYQLSASVKHRGHYYHEQCTEIDVLRNGEYLFSTSYSYVKGSESDGAALVILLRDFMQWIYKQLEKENDYQNSDEVTDENILANGYTFLEDGTRED